ncbi:MAG: hypothetical protein AB7L90_17425 [Hyphomicrobiaceae bacterium]|uniref:hypothetical protein n=1 Tax=Pseudorhodoplanes sp. TaxID=1934341 RepID=UPI003D09B90C
MDYHQITDLLGSDAVREMERLVNKIYSAQGDDASGRAALVELLMAMIAAVMLRDGQECGRQFNVQVEDVAKRLRELCMTAHSIRD